MELEKLSLVGRKTYKYNDDIVINIPTVGQIRSDNEQEESSFWSDVHTFIQTPSDMISELDSMEIDFEQMSDYELFIILFLAGKRSGRTHKSILFQNFSFWDLNVSEKDGKTVLIDKDKKTVINEEIYNDISAIIALMSGNKKTEKKKFGNAFAKKKRIEQDRKKKEMRKTAKKESSDVLGGIILRLVCNANFPYDFESVQKITIYDLIYSLKQIDKDIAVTDLIQTRLVGNDLSKIPRDQLSRFIL